MFKRITAKLGNMRKAVEWVVCPVSNAGGMVYIQSDKRICKFDPATGNGVLSASHNYPVFITLSLPSATPVVVPPDVVAACVEATPKSGDVIGSGVRVA